MYRYDSMDLDCFPTSISYGKNHIFPPKSIFLGFQMHVADMSPTCLVSRHLVSARMLFATFRVADIPS